MTTGSVNDKRSRCPFSNRSVEKVERVLEMFIRSLQKSAHQAARESRLTRHTILSMLHKELHYRPWNLHYEQELKPADCNRRMEYGELKYEWCLC